MTKASTRRIQKRQHEKAPGEYVTRQELNNVVERLLRMVVQIETNMAERIGFQDARGWVLMRLMDELVSGELKDLNGLRTRVRELADDYAHRQQEAAKEALGTKAPPAQGSFEVEEHGGS